MRYYWIYFLDDSWEGWLADMPTGGVLFMPNIEGYENGTRNFIILDEMEEMTSEYNCTINKIDTLETLSRLITSKY